MSSNRRREINWFADQMEKQMEENDHQKGRRGWKDIATPWLLRRAIIEIGELSEEIGHCRRHTEDKIIKECVDAANFLMMIADNARTTKNRREKEEKKNG